MVASPSLVQSLCTAMAAPVSVSTINAPAGIQDMLRDVAAETHGRFHAYTGRIDSPFFDGTPSSPELTRLLAEVGTAVCI